jgi:hypothetical protein
MLPPSHENLNFHRREYRKIWHTSALLSGLCYSTPVRIGNFSGNVVLRVI